MELSSRGPYESAVPRPFPPVKPPALAAQRGQSLPSLVELMRRLLAPDGCPWDRAQNLPSLRRYVLEEASEVVDALGSGSRDELREELGDLLFQVVFVAELARAEGAFGLDDAVAAIVAKLVRRHPHVFDPDHEAAMAASAHDWERIKAGERRRQGKPSGLLSTVPRSLPALARAQRVGEKAARVGFDWPELAGCRQKVTEELAEAEAAVAAGDREGAAEELGDVMFALVNLARHLSVDAEASLRQTVAKFIRRFATVEARAKEQHGGLAKEGSSGGPGLAELEAYWQEAKAAERSGPGGQVGSLPSTREREEEEDGVVG